RGSAVHTAHGRALHGPCPTAFTVAAFRGASHGVSSWRGVVWGQAFRRARMFSHSVRAAGSSRNTPRVTDVVIVARVLMARMAMHSGRPCAVAATESVPVTSWTRSAIAAHSASWEVGWWAAA